MKKFLIFYHKMVRKIVLFTIFCISFYQSSYALKSKDWVQIETENFLLIFRKNIYLEAQRVARMLDFYRESIHNALSLEKKVKVKIVLDNESATINGYASPEYMHFYTLQPQELLGNSDWLEGLVMHEYFHIAQFKKFLGFLNIPYNTIPERWFMEGDAVLAETALSNNGRGRVPHFSMVYRANLLSGKNYSFYHQYLGGPKVKTPDCYKVGYFLVCYLRKKYGIDFFNELVKTKGLKFLATFNGKLIALTQKSIQQHYEMMNEELLKLWRDQLDGVKITDVTKMGSIIENENFSFYCPRPYKNGVIAYRYDQDSAGEFVYIDEYGKYQHIVNASGNIMQNGFSVINDYILWTEEVDDVLWGSRGVSYIQVAIYDINKREKSSINHHTRYMSASISNSGDKILSVECKDDYTENFSIINFQTGEVEKKIEAEKGEHIKHPIWYDDNKILFISILNSSSALVLLNTENLSREIIIPYNEEVISKLTIYNNFVLFSSTYSGIDNIYAVNIDNRQVYQVVSRPFGAYSPSVDKLKGRLYFEDYQVKGMNISSIILSESNWIPIDQVQSKKVEYFADVQNQFTKNNLRKQEYEKIYDMYEYPILINSLTSWKISLSGMLERLGESKLSLILSSSDILHFYKFETGGEYKPTSNIFSIPAKITIKSLYPIISIYYSEDIGFSRSFSDSKLSMSEYINKLEREGSDDVINGFPRRHCYLETKFPLYYSNVWHDQSVEIELKNKLEYVFDKYTDFSWIQNNYVVSSSLSAEKSRMEIRPRFKNMFKTRYSHILYSEDIEGYSYNLSYITVLPGIAKLHSIALGVSNFMRTDYRLNNDELKYILSPIKFENADYYLKSNLTALQFDYLIPIAYPEWYFGNFAVDTIYTKLLFEYLYLNKLDYDLWRHPKTIGASICSQFNAMGLLFDAGIKICYSFFEESIEEQKKYVYSPDLNKNLWNLAFQISASYSLA